MNTSTPTAAHPISLIPKIRSALFEIAANDPEQAPRWTLWIISTLFVLLLIWATFAQLDIVAVAQGRLVPQTYVKIVQPAAAGIVRDIPFEAADQDTALGLVRNGLGVALLPRKRQ